MPYLIKNPAGTWCVQRKVPEKLQAAVARILGGKRSTQVYLKKSLATKDRREATRRAPHALADIERTLREAAAAAQVKPKAAVRTTLSDSEIKRMAEYVYANALAWDERPRYGRDEMKRMEAEHIRLGAWLFPYEKLPPYGLSPEQLALAREHLAEDLRDMREYLALGDISAVEHHIAEALDAFQINLDRQSAAYSKLGIEVLRAYVRALQDIERRNAGQPVSTPPLPTAPSTVASGTLREAFEGWKKERDRPEGTLNE